MRAWSPVGGGRDGWRVGGGGGGDEVEPGQRVEDEPAGGSGGGAAGESGHRAFWQDRASGFAFDEAEDQQGEADHRQERVDAAVVLEEHGRDGDRAFERAVAAFDDFLALCSGRALLRRRRRRGRG